MTDVSQIDVLGLWAARRPQRVRLYDRVVEAGLRFAFYRRISIEDYQDPASSRRQERRSALPHVRSCCHNPLVLGMLVDRGAKGAVS